MTNDNQTEGLEGSVGIMSDEEMVAIAARLAGIMGLCLSEDLERAVATARHYQGRALSAERVLDCGHPAACWNGRACQWCIDKECCEGNLWVLGEIKRIEERARIAEERAEKAELALVYRDGDCDVLRGQYEERVVVLEAELAKERQEGVVLYAALMRYVNRDDCDNDGLDDVCHYCQGVYAASIIPDGTFYKKGTCDVSNIPEDEQHLAAPHEHEHAAQATPDATGQGEGGLVVTEVYPSLKAALDDPTTDWGEIGGYRTQPTTQPPGSESDTE